MLTLRRYVDDSRRWEAAVTAVVPLFVVYEVGLLVLTSGEVRNLADVLLRDLIGVAGRGPTLLLNSLVLIVFVGALALQGSRRPLKGVVPLMVLESALWAVLLGPIALLVRDGICLAHGLQSATTAERVIFGIGAGLYEELLFRLVLVAGGSLLLTRPLRMDPITGCVVAIVGSSLLFSGYHHLGELGEPWQIEVFVFRFLAGVTLGLLFLVRGFGIVCWAHALYDVFLALSDLGRG